MLAFAGCPLPCATSDGAGCTAAGGWHRHSCAWNRRCCMRAPRAGHADAAVLQPEAHQLLATAGQQRCCDPRSHVLTQLLLHSRAQQRRPVSAACCAGRRQRHVLLWHARNGCTTAVVCVRPASASVQACNTMSQATAARSGVLQRRVERKHAGRTLRALAGRRHTHLHGAVEARRLAVAMHVCFARRRRCKLRRVCVKGGVERWC